VAADAKDPAAVETHAGGDRLGTSVGEKSTYEAKSEHQHYHMKRKNNNKKKAKVNGSKTIQTAVYS
jgi:hypothetical protein